MRRPPAQGHDLVGRLLAEVFPDAPVHPRIRFCDHRWEQFSGWLTRQNLS